MVNGPDGEKIASGFGLTNAEAGQRRIVSAALDARRTGKVGLGGAVADQVQHGPLVGSI